MLLGDSWHGVGTVGSKGGSKGMEKIMCRELPDWGVLAALCRLRWAQGSGQIPLAGYEMYGWGLVSFVSLP